MSLPFDLVEDEEIKIYPNIKVIGIGGAGGNAIANMIKRELKGVEFIVANTDYRVLELNPAPHKIHLGRKLTKGWGAGGNPEIGKLAAEESEKEIRDYLKDADMVFIAAGMGGGTGTGASPVIANICKELEILTIAVVTKPFSFEGKKRMEIAEAGIEELKKYVDTLITIPNDKLFSVSSPQDQVLNMFKKGDDVLYYAVKGISDLILSPGYKNLDFADIKAAMKEKGGVALIGVGEASGENRAEEATQMAVSFPLLEDIPIEKAKAGLINVSGNPDNFTVQEFQIVTKYISDLYSNIEIHWGMVFDKALGDTLRVTIIATGLENIEEKEEKEEKKERILSIKDMLKDEGTEIKSIKEIIDDIEIPTFLRKKAD